MMSNLYCMGSYCIESGHKRFSKSFGEKRLTMQADQRHLFALFLPTITICYFKTGDNEIHLSDHLVFD